MPTALRLLLSCSAALLAISIANAASLSGTAYDDAMSANAYAEAEDAAKRALAAALASGQPESGDTAMLYTELGDAQRLGGNPVAAARNYEAAIDVIERGLDRLDIALEAPLKGAARAYVDAGVAEVAIPALQRAIHVRQVHAGPHAPEQVDTLHHLADVQFALGLDDALTATGRRIAYLLARGRDDDPARADAYLRLGRLYGKAALFDEERDNYSLALAVVEEADAARNAQRVESHVRLGESFSTEYFTGFHLARSEDDLPETRILDDAQQHFDKALALADDDPADWESRVRAILAMADFMTLVDRAGEARRRYREAWGVLSADDSRLAARRDELEAVVPLLRPMPNRRRVVSLLTSRSPDDEAPPENIDIAFTVNRRGRLADFRLADERATPPGDDVATLLQEDLARFVYRPRVQNGLVVTTLNVRYRYPLDAASNPPP